MRVERKDLDVALLAFARSGHGLVLGRPGVGKTYSVAQLCRTLDALSVPYALFAVEEFGGGSEEELRTALGFQGTLQERLGDLFRSSEEGGVIVFDGFDAARNEDARARVLQHVRNTIRAAPESWSVLVSVRNYDAAKSPSLLEVFRGRQGGEQVPSTFQLTGIPVRHFAVPELTEVEVLSAITQIPGMADVYPRASDGFRRLVRVPFNLWLVERVVRGAADPEHIGALRSELQLLSLFWTTYVNATEDSDARTSILDAMVRGMVDGRRLSLRKSDLHEPAVAASWRALLSAEVLSEMGPAAERIGFAHNILFDFAVSVLAMGDDADSITAFLTADPARSLFLRPSIVYLLTRLWYEGRERFWSSFWSLLSHDSVAVRLVGRLIPPVIVATEIRAASELEPPLREYDQSGEAGASGVLRLLQALRFSKPADRIPWLQFVERLANRPDRVFAWELAAFLHGVSQEPGQNASAEAELCGRAARALFSWAWANRRDDESGWFDALSANLLLSVVLRTFGAAPTESAGVVRAVLGLLEEPNFPIGYFTTIADKVGYLVPHDPALVADVYAVVFYHVETSETPTHWGGIVMKFSGTRRQDFGMCHYVLAKAYPLFLRSAPIHAIPVAVNILNRFAITQHVLPYLREGYKLEDLLESVQFLGRERPYLPDFSVSWMTGWHDEENSIGDELTRYLASDELTVDPVTAVTAYADHALAAVTWARLLEAGAEAPARFATPLRELTLSHTIQLGSDTLQVLGTFIERAAEFWSRDERIEVERSLLELAAPHQVGLKGDQGVQERNEHIRDRLLARIPRQLLVTSAATQRIDQLLAKDALPGNAPLVEMSVSTGPYGPDEWLSERGVDLKAPPNARIRTLAEELSGFGNLWTNKAPDGESVAAILPQMREALAELEGLGSPAVGGVEETVAQPMLEYGWTKLAAVARAVARSHPPQGSDPYVLARNVLVAAAARPSAEVEANADAEYKWAHWSPTPRTEAIQGLTFLTWKEVDDELGHVIASFADSPDPAERLLALQYGAKALARTAPDLFWTAAGMVTEREQNAVVIGALLGSLGYGKPREQAEPLIRTLEGRWRGSDQRDLRSALADWLAYFALRREAGWALECIRAYAEDLDAHGEILSEVIFRTINLVTPVRVLQKEDLAVVSNAVNLIRETLELLRKRAARLKAAADTGQKPSVETWRQILMLVDHLVARTYFNVRRTSDNEEDDEAENENAGAPSTAGVIAYYRVIRPVLDDILGFSEAGVGGVREGSTAHNFMRLLNVLLTVDPGGVLDLAARLMSIASRGGYHLDSLAVGEVVTMTEVILADHRDQLREGKALDNMLAVLDVFADAGWPQALRLVWRLDEVFR